MPEAPEEYHAWFLVWSGLLYGGLSVFTVVAMVVTVKGWHEVKVMLSRLKESSDNDDSSNSDEVDSSNQRA